MHVLQTVLPILAATSLAAALLMPLRDDRRGKRATIGGRVPLLASFPSAGPGDAFETVDAVEQAVNTGVGDDAPATPRLRFFDGRLSARIIDAFRLGIFGRVAAVDNAAGDEEVANAASGCKRSFAEELQLLSMQPDDAELRTGRGEPTPGPIDQLQIVSALRQAQGDMDGASVTSAAHDAAATGDASAVGDARAADEPTAAHDATAADDGSAADDERSSGHPVAANNTGLAGAMLRNAPSCAKDQESASASAGARTWSVPPTRLPLRRAQADVQWPLELPIPQVATSRPDRHAALTRLVGNADASCERALRAAYEQEDLAGRIIALQALEHVRGDVSRDVLVDALRRGSDEERVVAVDALAGRDDRDALIEGLSDRVNAIAARAALGLVGTNVRADFERVLGPHVDRARLDALLALLAPALL